MLGADISGAQRDRLFACQPSNLALAVNSDCSSCGAFAYAYQYYVTADKGARLSDQGRAAVADIRAKVDDLVDDGLTYPELDAQLDTLAVQFHDAVLQDLQRADENPRGGEGKKRTERDGSNQG